MEDNRKKGRIGEESAVAYLKEKGYTIKEHNYLTLYGEIDIIGFFENTYIFIEVKYRKNINYGFPAEAVGFKKQEKIRNTALFYIAENNLEDYNFRFDVIEILGNYKNINHIENAF